MFPLLTLNKCLLGTGRYLFKVKNTYKVFKSSYQRCSIKNVFLKNFKSHKKTPLPEYCLITLQAQVFSCEFCKICKNTFLTEHPWSDCFFWIFFKYLSLFLCQHLWKSLTWARFAHRVDYWIIISRLSSFSPAQDISKNLGQNFFNNTFTYLIKLLKKTFLSF